MDRRDVLRAGVTGIGAAVAGCLGGFERQSAWRDPPLVADRPQAVYVPAITEGMALADRRTTNEYEVALTYSYPHRFWNVQGDTREKVIVDADDSIHLMASIWDRESGLVVPSSGVSLEILQGDIPVSQEVIYPMLSQQMGFHYGANFTLDGEGEYRARVSIGGLSTARTGEFADRFSEPRSVEIPFTFDTDELYDLSIRRLGDRQGTRDAIPPMDMDVPAGTVPNVTTGSVVGSGTSGDAQFTARVFQDEARFGEQPYLAVTAHTPYNQIVLPMMQLQAGLQNESGGTDTYPLKPTFDPKLGYHYGANLEEGVTVDRLELATELPPQVARHDGYETAFFEMPTVAIGG
ncbi:iron transporter [Halomarina litorea]|uniref:iron transporter n=1 Tax=Halomarina litorea TaxID=2961595 RepID=UPI0020C3256A|nr:iron transporter [Halomarina sp. BCD28]